MPDLPSSAAGLAPLDRLRAMADEFFGSLSPLTRKAYQYDLRRFAAFMGTDHIGEALRQLIEGGAGEAFATVTRYRTHLQGTGIKGASINRRLGALRTLLRFARSCGLIVWTVEVKNVKARPTRDTRGPGRAGMARLFAASEGTTPVRIRDRLILRLLYSAGFRRAEVSSLDLEHVDLARGTVAVLGKGREEREVVDPPASTMAALREWIAVRGTAPGPLILNFDATKKGRSGDRLMPEGVWDVFKRIAKRAGFSKYECSCHSLRHAGITSALEVMRGDVAKVQQFSRHKDVRTVIIYNDNRTNGYRKVAALMDSMDGVPDED